MKAKEIAEQAAALVAGERDRTHGDKLINFQNIADVWNGIGKAAGFLSKPLTAVDVGTLLEGLKIARRYSGEHNDDDYVDAAGYAACTGEVAARSSPPK